MWPLKIKNNHMKKIVTLIQTDLRQIFRDKTLTVFLFAPVILIVFVRFFVPYMTDQYPIVGDYHGMIMMFASIQTAIMFGFIISFIILEEKDENVLQVIRVLPISPFYFILYRLLFATSFSVFGAFLMINLGGIAYPGLLNSFLLSVQYGLTAPFITLIIATYAKNKVEGMAFFKGVDLVLLLPMFSFFIVGNMKYIFSIIPAFWTYSLFHASINNGNTAFYFIIGLTIYGIVISALFLQFKKRIFDR
jgi:fluoroquinolone transport system permease protein